MSNEYRRGVGIVLVNDRRRIFLGQRHHGVWHMPQGGMEEGETPRQAVFRELEEEVGTSRATVLAEHPGWLRYDLPEESRPKAWDGRYVGQEQKWFLLRFDGSDADIDIATADPEFTDWRWASAGEIQEGAVFFKRELYLQVFDAFRDWL